MLRWTRLWSQSPVTPVDLRDCRQRGAGKDDSGQGRTSVLMFRMLSVPLAHAARADLGSHPTGSIAGVRLCHTGELVVAPFAYPLVSNHQLIPKLVHRVNRPFERYGHVVRFKAL